MSIIRNQIENNRETITDTVATDSELATAKLGDNTQTFKVAPATLADEAVSKGQITGAIPLSGLNADLLDGYNLDENGIPLLRGYRPDGRTVNDNTDLDTISVNSVHNISGAKTANSPEAAWGFVTTYIHSGFSSTNAWRSQVFISMQSNNMHTRRGNPDGTWTPWVKMWNSGNDGVGSGLDTDLVRGLPADFTSSKATNGYQKLPSGLIIQWGTYSNGTNGTYTVSLPIAFPNADLMVLGYSTVALAVSNDGYSGSAGKDTLSTIKITIDEGINTTWIAIGY